jgi:carboxymethylenebutenolidase
MREKCDGLAEQGFIAIAPDLFWRQEPGVDLDVRSEADWQHGLRDTVDTAAKMPECTGKIAVLGYCLGALMVFLTAVRHRVDAAVAYHGGDTEKYLNEVDGLHASLLTHLGEEDEFISKPAQAAIKAALAKPNATVYQDENSGHRLLVSARTVTVRLRSSGAPRVALQERGSESGLTEAVTKGQRE